MKQVILDIDDDLYNYLEFLERTRYIKNKNVALQKALLLFRKLSMHDWLPDIYRIGENRVIIMDRGMLLDLFESLTENEIYKAGSMTALKRKVLKPEFRDINLTRRSNWPLVLNELQNLVRKQVIYFDIGNNANLLPFTQKELAREISMAPSSVSRAIRYKSLVTPWGEEIPLKHLLPGPKQFKKRVIRQLLQAETDITSDEATRTRLLDRYGVAISRRSVANLRQELKLPPRGKAGKLRR